MPCGDWESVCKLYNVRRSDLSQRTASSLTYLLKRAQRSSLQILQCARRLVLKSIEEIGSLQLFLQQKQALHDLSMLEFLSQHAPVCKQLAKVADAKVIDILLVLPGKLGSELWLQGMYEQFEIEGQVQLWRHSQQQVKGPLTMAQVILFGNPICLGLLMLLQVNLSYIFVV